MARISGVDLPREKRVEIALTYIYGIGRKTASDIIAATGVNPDIRVKDLSEDDVSKLREYIDHTARSRVTFAVRPLSISRDSSRSAAIAVSATARVCRLEASVPRPMPVHARSEEDHC